MIGPCSPTSPSARSGPVIWRDRVGHLHPPEVGHLHPPPTVGTFRLTLDNRSASIWASPPGFANVRGLRPRREVHLNGITNQAAKHLAVTRASGSEDIYGVKHYLSPHICLLFRRHDSLPDGTAPADSRRHLRSGPEAVTWEGQSRLPPRSTFRRNSCTTPPPWALKWPKSPTTMRVSRSRRRSAVAHLPRRSTPRKGNGSLPLPARLPRSRLSASRSHPHLWQRAEVRVVRMRPPSNGTIAALLTTCVPVSPQDIGPGS